MNMRLTILVMLSCLIFVTVSATTMQSLSLSQKTLRSDRVVIATVEKIRFERHPTKKRIYTLTTLKVIDSLRGNAKADMQLVVRQIGGTIGDWTQHVVGNAEFRQGEEVLVFLRHDPKDDLHFLVGMSQGKISVDVGEDSVLQRRFFHQGHHHSVRLIQESKIESDSLSTLAQQIREMSESINGRAPQ